jgi:hypothetical protein
MTHANVPRWTTPDADVPEELRQLLRRGRGELGDGDEVSELGRRLAIALGPASGLPGSNEVSAPASQARDPGAPQNEVARAIPRASGTGGVAGVGPSVAWVWGGALAVALAASGVGLWATQRSPREVPEASGSSRGGDVPVAPPAPVPTPSSAEPPTRKDDVAAPAAPRSPIAAEPSPSTRPGRARPSPHRAAPRASLEEAALLRRAQSELGRDPRAALALTREHETRFRHGALGQEREVIAIEALRRLGEPAAAAARAAAFERRYHGSVHRPRLERGTDTSAPTGSKGTTVVP